jgi:hypothetical protein
VTNALKQRRSSFAASLEVVRYRGAGDSTLEELLHAQLNVDDSKLGSGFCEDLDNRIADAAELALARPRGSANRALLSYRTPVLAA